MRKIKFMSLSAAALALAIGIAGCQSPAPGGKPKPSGTASQAESSSGIEGRITFISSRGDLVEKKAFDKYIAGFKQKYPSVEEVKVIGLKDYQTDIRVRILSNNYEDVLILPNNFSEKNLPEYFEPIDDLNLTDKIYYGDKNTYEGKHYAVTMGTAVQGIIYNKKAFQKAGITQLPASLAEFYEACEKLKRAGIIPVYLNYAAGWTLNQWGGLLAPVISGNPETLHFMSGVDAPFDTNNDLGKTFGVINTLVQRGYAEPDLFTNRWEESKKDLAAGRAAMYYIGNWAISQVLEQKDTGVKSEDIGFMPFPGMEGGKATAQLNSDGWYVVNKNSKNLPTAKAWVKYLIEESTFADDNGFMNTMKSRESGIPQIKEFMAFKPRLFEEVSFDGDFWPIADKAGVNFYDAKLIQEIAVAKDMQVEFDKLNAKWRAARAEYLKSK